ncbi:hypothetical protein BJ508DRAFT_328299 [Ascobolus immersus RN42]|uniref:Uncharacterized protein n=1 Tax=Ascobolus immersus RN42 TaxID=1160509 RepID=A0A3N4I0B1_ASCIM|nr:hypothetical protein BJ508DRAFT_328299 [Ascobolus immersus RN42]
MPEAIVVADFLRYIKTAGSFQYDLEIYPQSCPGIGCFSTTFGIPTASPKNELKLPLAGVGQFLEDNHIKTKGLQFTPECARVRGKEMGILLNKSDAVSAKDEVWLTVHFELNAQAVMIRTWELAAFIEGTHPARIYTEETVDKTDPATGLQQKEKKKGWYGQFGAPAFALYNTDPLGMSIAFYDHNRLIRASFRKELFYDVSWGPCPYSEPAEYARHFRQYGSSITTNTPIWEFMRKSNFLFNGFGTSHIDEVLLGALIPPWIPASTIFRNKTWRERLLQSTSDFFSAARSDEYFRNEPSASSSLFAFDKPPSALQFFYRFIQIFHKRVVLCTDGMVETAKEWKCAIDFIDEDDEGSDTTRWSRWNDSWIPEVRNSKGKVVKTKVWKCKVGSKTAYTIFRLPDAPKRFQPVTKELGETAIPDIGPTSFYFNYKWDLWVAMKLSTLPAKRTRGRPKKETSYRDTHTIGAARRARENALQIEELLDLVPDQIKLMERAKDRKHKTDKHGKHIR